MKTLIFLSITTILFSCTKGSVQNKQETTPDYAGTYDSPNGDTAYVSANGSFMKIEWSPLHNPHRFVFDSIIVNTDLSFTDNELCDYGNGIWLYRSIGSGRISANTLTFAMKLDGGDMNFNGIKKQ
jgi:hypothetical protein